MPAESPTPPRGFTLIEMMIVVAMVALLAAVALPSYNQYVLRSHRADAKIVLLSLAQRLEQNYTLAGRYDRLQDGTTPVDAAMITGWSMHQSPAAGAPRYTIALQSISETGYVITATPVGAQTKDACGVLSVNERNLKAANGLNPNTAGVSRSVATQECWNR